MNIKDDVEMKDQGDDVKALTEKIGDVNIQAKNSSIYSGIIILKIYRLQKDYSKYGKIFKY